MIWAGKTAACHPKDDDSEPFMAKLLNHDHSESHWSTVDTMKTYVSDLVEKHIEAKRKELNLPADQKSVLIMDVYSAHRDKSFLQWVKDTYPFLIVLFVPANFTPFCQPLDVSFNAVFKGLVMWYCAQWFSVQVAMHKKVYM